MGWERACSLGGGGGRCGGCEFTRELTQCITKLCNWKFGRIPCALSLDYHYEICVKSIK